MSAAGRRPPVPVVLAAGVATAFFAVPLLGILQRAEWSELWADITSPQGLAALRLSLVCSLSAAAMSILFGTPLAWVLARTSFPGRSLVRGLVLVPMVLPPVVAGVALLSAFSLRSPVGSWLDEVFGIQLTFSTAGAVLAATFVSMPFYVITVEAALRNMDRRFEDVAASLGVGRYATFARVILPLAAPSMIAGAVLAWARALGEFGATITFAGNVEGRTRTLPLEVYLQLESDQQAAIASSLLLLAVALGVLVALRDRWFIRA